MTHKVLLKFEDFLFFSLLFSLTLCYPPHSLPPTVSTYNQPLPFSLRVIATKAFPLSILLSLWFFSLLIPPLSFLPLPFIVYLDLYTLLNHIYLSNPKLLTYLSIYSFGSPTSQPLNPHKAQKRGKDYLIIIVDNSSRLIHASHKLR